MKARPIDEKQYVERMRKGEPEMPLRRSQAGEYIVTAQYGKAKEPLELDDTEEGQLEVRAFVTEPARVEVELGRSLNLGNYSTARIYVRVSLPCYAEELEDAYAHAFNFARDRVEETVSRINKSRSDPK
jgi:hypothetical protein